MLGKDPDFAVVGGLIDAQRGEITTALETLGSASDKEPKDPAPVFYRGEVLYWQRRFAEADQAWTAAADLARKAVDRIGRNENAATEEGVDPERARLEFYLGAALNRRKEYASARDHLELAIDRGFSPVLANHQIGLGFLFDKQWRPAKEHFDTVIEDDELFAPAYFYRAMAWDKLGRKDRMLDDLDKFVTLAPDAPEAARARSILAASRR
jgi:tetratricopeptide (TPR) repeat protein